jgi:transcriptional regulator with XRE-family HTH domain
MPAASEDARGFGSLIRETREGRGWSQDDLAEKSGVSRPTIQRYETGKTAAPDPDAVRKIVRTLDLDPREVVVAIGFITRTELGATPKQPPALDAVLARARRLLEDPAIPDRAKDTLRRGINAAIELWYEAYGVGQAPREPSAEQRGSGRSRGRRSGQTA